MERKDGVRRTAYRTAAILLAICAAGLLAGTKGGEREKGVGTLAAEQMEEAMISLWCPALSFAKSPSDGGVMKQLCSLFPVLLFYGQEEEIDLQSESAGTYEAIVRAEGRDIMGIFTGEFDNISQARDAVKNGGIIDGISSVLDKIIDKTSDSGIISSNVANLISNGKDAILNSVNSNIENEFMEQINGVDLLAKYEDNWKECFENKDFEGMQREYEKIEDKLEALMPLESTLKEARVIENLHNLIKNKSRIVAMSFCEPRS